MISAFFRKLRLVLTDSTLRARILFILGAFVLFRFLAAIPVPGINRDALEAFFLNNQFFGLLNIFSGGGFSNLSLVMLGVGPYITASIIMQLSTILFPKVKALYSEEGEAGRAKFTAWGRYLTVPIAVTQGIAFLTLLQNSGIIAPLSSLEFATNVLLIAAGSMLLMWIGELITEFGIGNGVSLIIFAGIAAGLPTGLAQAIFTATAADIPAYLGFAAIGIAVIYAVVSVSEAERSVPIAYARQVRGVATSSAGASTYLPIRLLQAGVIPIIFALSLLLLPQMILAGIISLGFPAFQGAFDWYTAFSANPWAYGAAYFALVVMFTFFYTSITFEPKRVADNLQKGGAFVPGVRPGPETERYIANVVARVTFPGALFLGAVAVIPFVVQGITGISSLVIGGTALLIAVQVVLDLIRKIDAQLSLREY
ncbi:MAG: preprotein translocase subunit SecY [Candidatus Pacebacteria bacterium]|nr:preprotein translocase subunit SecY [Candidatus Paceibacterota bacterium]MBP9840181.1 preprotein translocase subunit SecY [Candidatus Paceibacterota bacterium]